LLAPAGSGSSMTEQRREGQLGVFSNSIFRATGDSVMQPDAKTFDGPETGLGTILEGASITLKGLAAIALLRNWDLL